jgi:glycosyltransferase involved in cell wall biosynthesis
MDKDRYKEGKDAGVDCICLTLNAERHLQETLDAFYKEVPIRKLLVIDGGSTDATRDILNMYPRQDNWIKPGMTTGKAWELLKDKVQTPWLVWIDVGKIPTDGWYDTMLQFKGHGDLLGSLRYNDIGGLDSTISDPSKRLLGGPWLIRTESLKNYHVDDDYAQRNIDIIIRKQLEDGGGEYHLVTSTYHTCYLPTPVKDKEILKQRHIQNAKGIVKYITPEYAKEHASYLLDDHWMLMMNDLPRKWILETNPTWIPILKKWRAKRLLIAKASRLLYGFSLRFR